MAMSYRELYPQGNPTLDQHHELLHRHARKLESSIQQDVAANQRTRELEDRVDDLETKTEKKLDKIDREMSDQTQALVDIKLGMARRDGDTKRLNVWIGLVTPVIAVLGTLLANYLSKPSNVPDPVHLTHEQRQQLLENEATPKR